MLTKHTGADATGNCGLPNGDEVCPMGQLDVDQDYMTN